MSMKSQQGFGATVGRRVVSGWKPPAIDFGTLRRIWKLLKDPEADRVLQGLTWVVKELAIEAGAKAWRAEEREEVADAER